MFSMKKLLFYLFLFISFTAFSQIDYSDSWEDFYSYNNVKDFVKVDNILYALADNAVFKYDENTKAIEKFSSIQGLSGGTTSSIHFNKSFNRLIIGYENGLIEVIDENGGITISSDIVNFNQFGEKRINHISEFGSTLYLSTPFAIVEYDIENLEFGDTFFIGNQSTSLNINKSITVNDIIYAVTEDGIFNADVNSNLLIDFNNWNQLFSGRNFSNIATFNNRLFVTENSNLYELDNGALNLIQNFSEPIINLKASSTNLLVSLNKSARVFDSSLNELPQFGITTDFDFTLSGAFFENNIIYLSTQEFGILRGSSIIWNMVILGFSELTGS